MRELKISQAFTHYMEAEIVACGLSKKTYESYFYSKKLAVGFFGDVKARNIRAEDVRDYYSHLLTWQRPDTARGHIICLRAVLRHLGKQGVKVLDADLIKVPKREKRTVEFLTPPEMEEFVAVVGEHRRGYAEVNRLRNIAIVKLLCATGLRVGELCRLNRSSIKGRRFTVVGKSKTPRVCFITEDVEAAIAAYLDKRTDDDSSLFVSNQNCRRITPAGVRNIFKSACARSEFEGVHPHTLRHSFATKLLDRGVDLAYIAELLGHESLDTTRLYTHVANPKLQKVYEAAMRGA